MPERVCQKYQLQGWRSVVIYSEQEMADALSLSRDRLRAAIEGGLLVYHAHPTSNALREYQFNTSAYRGNQKRWACLEAGGHHWQFENFFAPGRSKFACACGAERWD